MGKFFKTLVSLVVTTIGLAWEFPVRALDLMERIMTVLHMPDVAHEILKWFQEHPNLVEDIGPWVLVGGGLLSLFMIHAWPILYRWLNPIEFYLERDIKTGMLGLQSFPSGVIFVQVRVRTKMSLKTCRAYILLIEYRDDNGSFVAEHNERFPCQWSWSATDDHRVIDLSTQVPGAFNLATVGNGVWGFEPIMPTNIMGLLQREGVHRFTINVTGFADGREKFLTKKLLVDWRGAKRLPDVRFEGD
jgi:hypothetical protein